MGGEWSASRPGRALPPGKGPPVPIVQEAGWAPEPVWTQGLEENVGNRTPIVQPVVRHYTAWAIAASYCLFYVLRTTFARRPDILIRLYIGPSERRRIKTPGRKKYDRHYSFKLRCHSLKISTKHIAERILWFTPSEQFWWWGWSYFSTVISYEYLTSI
jgi:hypothetical protein